MKRIKLEISARSVGSRLAWDAWIETQKIVDNIKRLVSRLAWDAWIETIYIKENCFY